MASRDANANRRAPPVDRTGEHPGWGPLPHCQDPSLSVFISGWCQIVAWNDQRKTKLVGLFELKPIFPIIPGSSIVNVRSVLFVSYLYCVPDWNQTRGPSPTPDWHVSPVKQGLQIKKQENCQFSSLFSKFNGLYILTPNLYNCISFQNYATVHRKTSATSISCGTNPL